MTSGVPVQAIDLGVVSNQGRVRPRNEDAYGYEVLYNAQGTPTGWIFVVADGVGGEYHGDIASAMAVRGVIEVYKGLNLQNPLMPPADKLGEAIQFTNADIYNKATELNVAGHMGTTVVAAVLRPDGVLSVAWVGDSRLYVISRRLDRIRQVSQDHTEVAEQVRQKRISQDQAANHPRRNVLSRSVGGQPETVPEFAEGALEHTDTIVICSDGLTRHLSPDHIKTLVLQSAPSEQTANQLVGAANQMGGKDNITALVVHIGSRESQMDTNPPALADSAPPSALDSAVYAPPPTPPTSTSSYESTPPLLNDTPKKPERSMGPVYAVLTVIAVIAVIVLGFVFVSQQTPPAAVPTTDVADTDVTQEVAVTTAEATDPVEASITAEVTSEPALIPTATVDVNVTLTSQALLAGQTQTSESLNLAATTVSQAGITPTAQSDAPTEIMPTASEAVEGDPAQGGSNIIQLVPNMIPTIGTAVAEMLGPNQNATVGVAASETPAGSATTAPMTDPNGLVTPLVVASDTPSGVTIVVANPNPPYQAGTCLVTKNNTPVYSFVNASPSFQIPANRVVYVIAQGQNYFEDPNGKGSYHTVKPNDGSSGSGWVSTADIVPARNLSPEEQAAAVLVKPSSSIPQAGLPEVWSVNQAVKLTSSELNCLPVRLDAQVDTQVYILEKDTPATILSTTLVDANGYLWWHVRLPDGREGWVQQIYLDEVTTQQ